MIHYTIPTMAPILLMFLAIGLVSFLMGSKYGHNKTVTLILQGLRKKDPQYIYGLDTCTALISFYKQTGSSVYEIKDRLNTHLSLLLAHNIALTGDITESDKTDLQQSRDTFLKDFNNKFGEYDGTTN